MKQWAIEIEALVSYRAHLTKAPFSSEPLLVFRFKTDRTIEIGSLAIQNVLQVSFLQSPTRWKHKILFSKQHPMQVASKTRDPYKGGH